MKQRIITGLIGLVIFFIVLAFYDTVLFTIAVAIISLVAVHELLLTQKCTKSIPLSLTAMIVSITPFVAYSGKDVDGHSTVLFNMLMPIIYGVAFLIMLLVMSLSKKKISFKQTVIAFLTSLLIPFAFCTLVMLRNEFSPAGLYYTILIFACAWGADTGAYFTGRFFGKRKLAPKISPNKTIEGLYGGIVSCLLFVALVTTVYYFIMQSMGETIIIHYIPLAIISVIGALFGVMGDLSASMIKRQCGVKDFGTIMPGHGGIMDRFDSVLFIAPYFFIILQFFKLVS